MPLFFSSLIECNYESQIAALQQARVVLHALEYFFGNPAVHVPVADWQFEDEIDKLLWSEILPEAINADNEILVTLLHGNLPYLRLRGDTDLVSQQVTY